MGEASEAHPSSRFPGARDQAKAARFYSYTEMDEPPRACVLDALALDGELESLLLGRLERVCGGGRELDLKLALRALVLFLGADAAPAEALLRLRRVAGKDRVNASSGAALELPARPGLERSREQQPRSRALATSRRLLLGCLVVLLPWAWARLSRWLAASCPEDEEPRRARWLRLMRRIEGVVALSSVLVTLRYLHRGGSPTLPMLLCGIQLVPIARAPGAPPLPPAFDFMEQQVCARNSTPFSHRLPDLVHRGKTTTPDT